MKKIGYTKVLDIEEVIKYLANNEEAYFKILKNFKFNYKILELDKIISWKAGLFNE